MKRDKVDTQGHMEHLVHVLRKYEVSFQSHKGEVVGQKSNTDMTTRKVRTQQKLKIAVVESVDRHKLVLIDIN